MDESKWLKFIAANKLKPKSTEGDWKEVPGKLGVIYQYDDDEAAAMYIPSRPRKGWKVFKDKLTALGAVVVQDGDMEGAVSFKFDNGKATRAACSILRIPNKRTLSPERRAILTAHLAKYRASL